MTKTHCIGYLDKDTGEEFYFGPAVPKGHPKWDPIIGNPAGSVEDGVRFAEEADTLVFHNGIDFDYRAMEKFHGFVRPKRSWDTFILAKLVWPAEVLLGPDLVRARQGKLPMQLLKSHSLKAWGYRLGELKDEYRGDYDKYPEDGNPATDKLRYEKRWEEWNPYLASYMMQDNRPMVKLWKLIEKRLGWVEPEKADLVWPEFVIEYEHEAAHIIAEQETFGVNFDVEKARKMEAKLLNEKARLSRTLEETFGSWWQPGDEVTPKIERNVKRTDLPNVTIRRIGKTGKELQPYVGPPMERYAPDAPYTPIERLTFKASSRDHLGMRLQDVYGWKPKKFGKGKDGQQGKPTVDESVLEEIPEAVLPKEVRKLILDFFVVNKTLGMLGAGSKAWLHLVDDTGRLHGRVDTNGAVTRRGTHANPNLGQCPAVRKAKVVLPDGTKTEVILYDLEGRYGYECRELFTADDGWEQTGVDASALELIDLGHYLVPYDEGAFRDRVCDPKRDPHTEHAELTGLTRGDTKTATYLYIYGGSAYKLSLDISIEDDELPELLIYRGLPMMLRSLAKRFDDDFVAKLDDRQKAKIVKARKIILSFEEGITGIKDLKENVTKAAEKGWLRGMDGSRLHVRKSHAALNTLLQSAGAMTCKLWMVLTHRKLRARGLTNGVDFKQVLWVHDELQFTHKPGLADVIKECAYEAIREAGEMLGLRGVYRGDAKTGANWAECH
jgi:DNA polymerase I-like protein with 3'-5' exonuclease and polymerase domains